MFIVRNPGFWSHEYLPYGFVRNLSFPLFLTSTPLNFDQNWHVWAYRIRQIVQYVQYVCWWVADQASFLYCTLDVMMHNVVVILRHLLAMRSNTNDYSRRMCAQSCIMLVAYSSTENTLTLTYQGQVCWKHLDVSNWCVDCSRIPKLQ